MTSILKSAILSAAVAATVLGPLAATAEAGDFRHRPYAYRHHRHHNDALAYGIFGLAAGAIVGGLIAESRADARPIYREPVPVGPDYYPPAPGARGYQAAEFDGALEPWTPEWYRYCADRYRSFNSDTGTYRGYDGRNHFCVAD